MSYSNQYSRVKRHTDRYSRWRWLIIVAAIITLVAVLFFIAKNTKQYQRLTENVTHYSDSMSTWVQERKQHLNQKVAAVKQTVTVSDDREHVVNFEFYKTLQDMKSMQVDTDAAVSQKQEPPAIAKTAEKAVKVVKAAKPAKPAKPAKISHAADIERELLAAMKNKSGGK